MMGFENPVVGGTALRIPAIQSPNYTPGVAGWIIKIDGSAEFNNLTIRGEFDGSDFIINMNGIFLYNGTPANGNLIGSWTPAAGTDAFGNTYVKGFSVGLNTTPQVILDQTSTAGFMYFPTNRPNNAVLSELLVAVLNLNAANEAYTLQMRGPSAVGAGDRFVFELNSQNNDGSTDATAILLAQPSAKIVFRATKNGVDIQDGLTVLTALTKAGATWQTPTAATNWAINTLQYRLDAEDNAVWVGELHYTGANVTAAGGSAATVAVPSGFRPAVQWKVPLVHYTSASVQKNTSASAAINTDGTLMVFWGDGVAGSTHDVNGLATGDIFWIETRVPLGNIA